MAEERTTLSDDEILTDRGARPRDQVVDSDLDDEDEEGDADGGDMDDEDDADADDAD